LRKNAALHLSLISLCEIKFSVVQLATAYH
jgi:hypothetical protein